MTEFDGRLPEGWHISARLMAALTLPDKSLIEVSRGGEYYITSAEGIVISHGTDYHPSPMVQDWPDVLCGFLSFVEHDAELYQIYMGQLPEHDDGYVFDETVAVWAYMNSDEITMARLDMDPEGTR